MSDFIVNAPYNSLFIIYLLIACNYLAQLFGCKLQNLLSTNMYVKHLFGFLTMLFSIILIESTMQKDPEQKKSKYLNSLFYAIIFYIWFWSTTKTNIYFTLAILLIFMIIYIIQLEKNSLTESDEDINYKKSLAKTQFYLAIISLIFTIVGLVIYIKSRMIEYKDNWSIKKFIFGEHKCLNNNY